MNSHEEKKQAVKDRRQQETETKILHLRAETMLTFMADDIKPFLLTALLEDAGAVKADIKNSLGFDTSGQRIEPCLYWLLPVPEDTE